MAPLLDGPAVRTVRTCVMVVSLTRRDRHRVPGQLRVLRVAHLDRLVVSRMILVVSMPVAVLRVFPIVPDRLFGVLPHTACTLPATLPPILPHGLYTESAVMASSTNSPPTA